MHYGGFYANTKKETHMDPDGFYDLMVSFCVEGIIYSVNSYGFRGGYVYLCIYSEVHYLRGHEPQKHYEQVAKNLRVYLITANDYAFAQHIANYMKESVYDTPPSSTMGTR